MSSIVKPVQESSDESNTMWMVWLDPSTDVKKNKEGEARLRAIVNNFKKFQEVKPCQKYIERCSDTDEIILIVTGQLGKQIIPNIHELEHVTSIYIFCYDLPAYTDLAKQYTKVKAVVNNFGLLIARLSEDLNIQKTDDEPLPFDIFTSSGVNQSTMNVNGQFVFSQVLFDCLLRLKYNQTDRNELIKVCKQEYQTDQAELENIDQFEMTYTAEKALQWYTKDIFLFKSLNAALRKQNTHMIYLFREFIADIQQQLNKLQTKEIVKVYRGQMMSSDEIDRLKQSKGKLISINSFFSTTLNKKKAFEFFKQSRGLQRVLFEIDIDPKTAPSKPFADISSCSVFPGEAEVLFMIGSIFRLDGVTFNETDSFWQIRMILSGDEENFLREVLSHMKKEMGSGATNLRTLARFLWRMGKFQIAEKYYSRLLKELKANDPLLYAVYGDLAEIEGLKGNYDMSVQYRQKALKIQGAALVEGGENAESMTNSISVELTTTTGTTQQYTTSSETRPNTDTDASKQAAQFKQLFDSYLRNYIRNLAQQSSMAKRHANSVENFCYVIENQNSITDDDKQMLRGLINFGFAFDDINSEECVKIVPSIQNERIILILSRNSIENLAKEIRQEPFLAGIYVLDSSKDVSSDLQVYRGAFTSMTKLCRQLERDLPTMAYDLTKVSSIPENYAKFNFLSYVQTLKAIALDTDENIDLKTEMIEFCREKYVDNVVQLKFIDEFEKNFQPNQAVEWYSRTDAFVYKMLTRAFRIFDANILYKLRYIIQHLHQQILSSNDRSTITIYRTIRVRSDLFKNMCTYQSGLLSFNEFLLASTDKTMQDVTVDNQDSKLVYFQMNLDVGVTRCSIPNKSNEILLTMGTVFRIDSAKQINDKTLVMKLTTSATIQSKGPAVTKTLYDAVRGAFPLVSMLKLMKNRSNYAPLEYFTNLLEQDPRLNENDSAILALASACYTVGDNYYDIKQFDEALIHLEKALDISLRVVSPDDTRLSPTYNRMGNCYFKKNIYEKAFEHHRKAYEIQKNCDDPDADIIIAYIGNIVGALDRLGKYKESIKYLSVGIQIQHRMSTDKDRAGIAVKYFNLAKRQYRVEKYKEALESYETCLKIELQCHSDDNPTVADTYNSIAEVLVKLGQRAKAKEALEKAIERLLRTKGEDDEKVQMNRRQIQQIDQKLWMKNIFSDT